MYTGVAYWVLTNRQMFFNQAKPIYYQQQAFDSEHPLFIIPDCDAKYLLIFIIIVLVLSIAYEF
jgi:hypothetical protein